MDFFVNYLVFFGALFALVIAIGQAARPEKELMDYIFIFSFIGLSFWLLQISLYSCFFDSGSQIIYYLIVSIIPATFVVPPLIVLRYRWIISDRFYFKKSYVVLFIPALVSMLIILAPVFFDFPGADSRQLFRGPVLSGGFHSAGTYDRVLFMLFPLPKLYLIITMFPNFMRYFYMRKRTSNQTEAVAARIGFLFALSITIANLLAFAGDLFSFQLVRAAVIFANFSMCGVYVATQRNPQYTRLLAMVTKKMHYEKSRIMGLDVEAVVIKLHMLMNEEKVYTDEELSLKELSDETGIKPHQLSQILNEKLGKNFNTFVNEYRVEEAKRLLLDNPERSVLSAGMGAGFNSNTTFITVFSRMTGTSPGQFRKNALKNTQK